MLVGDLIGREGHAIDTSLVRLYIAGPDHVGQAVAPAAMAVDRSVTLAGIWEATEAKWESVEVNFGLIAEFGK